MVGYGFLATALYRTGYATGRLAVLLPILATLGTCTYAIVVGLVAPFLRSPEATLALTILPIAASRERYASILADRWHLAVIAYAEGAMVLIGFLLLAILGLA